jgi:hypothetical protein
MARRAGSLTHSSARRVGGIVHRGPGGHGSELNVLVAERLRGHLVRVRPPKIKKPKKPRVAKPRKPRAHYHLHHPRKRRVLKKKAVARRRRRRVLRRRKKR